MARYDMTSAECEAMSASIAERFDLVAPIPDLLGESIEEKFLLIVPGNHPVADMARATELKHFNRWFGYGIREMHDEYGDYEAMSHFIVIFEPARNAFPIVLRAIEDRSKTVIDLRDRKAQDGSPFYGDVEGATVAAVEGKSVVELATVARDHDQAKNLVDNLLLYAGTIKWTIDRGFDIATSSLLPELHGIFAEILGMNWQPLVGNDLLALQYHAGGEVIPGYIAPAQVRAEMEARAKSDSGEIAQLVVEGLDKVRFSFPRERTIQTAG